MARQRLSTAWLVVLNSARRRIVTLVLVRIGCFRFRHRQAGLGREERQLLPGELLTFAPGFGFQQLPQQALGAVQLRRHVHEHPLQRLGILRQCFGIDGHCLSVNRKCFSLQAKRCRIANVYAPSETWRW